VKEHPELKERPFVAGAALKGGKGRGIVSTCSYGARKYGIDSAMPISKAYKLCPNCVFLLVNMRLYKDLQDINALEEIYHRCGVPSFIKVVITKS
jgi:DNA polymerase IV (DinB-like DNA polymerase)